MGPVDLDAVRRDAFVGIDDNHVVVKARLGELRNAIQNDLGIDVDLSIIRQGGQFDSGPQLPLSFGF